MSDKKGSRPDLKKGSKKLITKDGKRKDPQPNLKKPKKDDLIPVMYLKKP